MRPTERQTPDRALDYRRDVAHGHGDGDWDTREVATEPTCRSLIELAATMLLGGPQALAVDVLGVVGPWFR